MMCEQMGSEPIAEEIPADFSDFPWEVQTAINIFYILPDRFEGMSGTYMGKDFSILPYLFDEIYGIENKKQTMQFILLIGRIVSKQYSDAQKARERKAKNKKGGIHING